MEKQDCRKKFSHIPPLQSTMNSCVITGQLCLFQSSQFLFNQIPFRPLFGEIEISKLFRSLKEHCAVSISAVAGSSGYLSPEYAYTMQVKAPGYRQNSRTQGRSTKSEKGVIKATQAQQGLFKKHN